MLVKFSSSIFSFVAPALCVRSKKPLYIQSHEHGPLSFLLWLVLVLALILRPLMHSEVNFYMKYEREVPLHSFNGDIQLSQTICWRNSFPYWIVFGIPVKNQFLINTQSLWTLFSLSLIYMSILIPELHCIDYCRSIVTFEIWVPQLCSFLRLTSLLGSFAFP